MATAKTIRQPWVERGDVNNEKNGGEAKVNQTYREPIRFLKQLDNHGLSTAM